MFDIVIEMVEVHGHVAVFAGYFDVLGSIFDILIVETLYFACFGCILQSVDCLLVLTHLLADTRNHYVLTTT